MAAEPSARSAALGLLRAVLEEGRLLSDIGETLLSGLPGPERARAQRLALGVLRNLAPLDRALKPRLRKPPPAGVHSLLRIGAFELSEGAPPHGVVSALVDLAKSDARSQRYAGLVNAVLRGLDSPLQRVGENRLPDWLRLPLIATYSRRGVEAMERVWSRSPPIDLTLKPGAVAPEGGDLLPNGSLRFPPGVQISALSGYEAGDWWVQDAAAAMAVPLLGPLAGRRALDLCAAPGGKTLQLAAGGAEVTAIDHSAPRLDRLRANLQRTRLTADCHVADALDWPLGQPFDLVLLDAPCSATGTIRRHPDLPHARSGMDLAPLLQLQARLLDRALAHLAPGGRLCYVVCSLLPEEGEAQIDSLLARSPELEVLDILPPGAEAAWRCPQGLRLRPDLWAGRGGMDGFFLTVLQRKSRR